MSEKYKVAVVDDDQSVLSLYEALLSERYHLFLYSNPQEFLNSLNQESPDLLIVDLIMPGVNALSFLQDLKNHSKAPVIAVSGSRDSRVTSGALHQTQAFITKPFDNMELIQVIDDFLGTDRI